MALFKKRLSLNEILKAISALSPEDKEKVRAAAESEAPAEEARDETVQDEAADDHSAEIIKALTDRVIALEDGMKTLKALQDRMEEYDARNAEKFGYHGKPGDKRQDISEMSASELKEKILSGQH